MRALSFNWYGPVGSVLRAFPPETARKIAVKAYELGLPPDEPRENDPMLKVRLWNLEFQNPVGLAAGFDKDARVLDRIFGAGFSFMEAGTVTPMPQPGNSGTRMFRLTEQKAVVNRFGFNSCGLNDFARRIAHRRRSNNRKTGIIGANIGKNRQTENVAADYAQCIRALTGLVDYIAINISSPNTPGLRSLQMREELDALLEVCIEARNANDSGIRTPLLLKISPDLSDSEKGDIADVCMSRLLDGVIISNTTSEIPNSLRSRGIDGGLSGAPLFIRSTKVLEEFYQHTDGKIPLVGVGGVFSGADAYQKICSGASLIQLYTAFSYSGPKLINQINMELVELLKSDGYSSVVDAVGSKFGNKLSTTRSSYIAERKTSLYAGGYPQHAVGQ